MSNDTPLRAIPATAAEEAGRSARRARAIRNTVVGGLLVLGAVATVLISKWLDTLDLLTVVVALSFAVTGGLFMEKDTFTGIATSAIDAIPGGEK